MMAWRPRAEGNEYVMCGGRRLGEQYDRSFFILLVSG